MIFLPCFIQIRIQRALGTASGWYMYIFLSLRLRGRERLSIHWFNSQVVALSETEVKLGARNFLQVSHLSGNWAILHCFLRSITKQLDSKWNSETHIAVPIWDTGFTGSSFTQCWSCYIFVSLVIYNRPRSPHAMDMMKIPGQLARKNPHITEYSF